MLTVSGNPVPQQHEPDVRGATGGRPRRYVILYANVFTERMWVRLGGQYFHDCGYEVVPVEFFDYLLGRERDPRVYGGLASLDRAVRITSAAQFDAMVSWFDGADIILNCLPVTQKTRPFFEILTRHGTRYGVQTLAKLPDYCRNYAPVCLGLRDLMRRTGADLANLLSKMKSYLLQKWRNRAWGDAIQGPDWHLDAGEFRASFNYDLPDVSASRRISVRAFDVEIASGLQPGAPPPAGLEGDFAVFLDDGFLGNPDYDFQEIPDLVDKDRYAASMDRLFRHIEDTFGIKTVIALHPKSDPALFKVSLSGWPVVQGGTADLVRRCRFAIAQCSTSVSFAVIFNKPVLFATTEDIERHHVFGPLIARLSSWLGARRLVVDSEKTPELRHLPGVNARAFGRFEKAFLRDASAANQPIWAALKDAVGTEA